MVTGSGAKTSATIPSRASRWNIIATASTRYAADGRVLNANSHTAATKPWMPRSSRVRIEPTPVARWKLTGSCCSFPTVFSVNENCRSMRVFQVSQFWKAPTISRATPSASRPTIP